MMEDSGFRAEHAQYFNLFGMFGWLISGRILNRTVLPKGQLRLYDRLVPVFRPIERLLGPPLGQSLIVVGRKQSGEGNSPP